MTWTLKRKTMTSTSQTMAALDFLQNQKINKWNKSESPFSATRTCGHHWIRFSREMWRNYIIITWIHEQRPHCYSTSTTTARLISTLHSAHQGETTMLLQANSTAFMKKTSQIHDLQVNCNDCNRNAPSQPNAAHSFQNIADYFKYEGYDCIFCNKPSGLLIKPKKQSATQRNPTIQYQLEPRGQPHGELNIRLSASHLLWIMWFDEPI